MCELIRLHSNKAILIAPYSKCIGDLVLSLSLSLKILEKETKMVGGVLEKD
jgi:hypothetical protein